MTRNSKLPIRARRVIRDLRSGIPSGVAIGRLSPGDGPAEFIPLSEAQQSQLDALSTTRGHILFRGEDGWETLAPGTAGQLLKTNGPGDDPEWGFGGEPWAVVATGTGASQTVTLPLSDLDERTVAVFVNGIRYETSEYSTSGTDLTLTTNAAGDSIEIVPLTGVGAGGGGGASPLFDPPTTTSLPTTVNTRTSTSSWTDDENVGLIGVFDSGSDDDWALRLKPTSVPGSGTRRFVCHISGFIKNNDAIAFIMRNSSNGRMLICGIGDTNKAIMQRWANTSWAGTDANKTIYSYDLWVRADVASTGDVDFYISPDGGAWLTFGQTTLAAYLLASGGSFDQVGIGKQYRGTGIPFSCSYFKEETV